MQLTTDTVEIKASDSRSLAAGRGLASEKHWSELGQNPQALWGQCRGSSLYQVCVDTIDLASRCSCPSRKFPCKHALGLMLLAATSPQALPRQDPPDWVLDWLGKRASKKDSPSNQPASSESAIPSTSKADSASKRATEVARGLETLNLWMEDIVRDGLAALQNRKPDFWEQQAKRMVDFKAPSIAARLRRMAWMPHGAKEWPAEVLNEFGKLALLSQAYRRLDQLPSPLQEDVRQAIGWPLRKDRVLERGETVEDDWFVIGQDVRGEEQLFTQRNWLLGRRTGRYALVLQFAANSPRFGLNIRPGTHKRATLVYWPSAFPQRALIATSFELPLVFEGRLSGFHTLEEFLDYVATAASRQPWLESFPCVLNEVVPVLHDGTWLVSDNAGHALPLAPEVENSWWLLALSGGKPLDLALEWDGRYLKPLSAMADGCFFTIERDNL